MKHSIFWKLVLIIFPLILIADTLVLAAAYFLTYELTMVSCRENVEHAALVAASYFEMADINSENDLLLFNESFDDLCKNMDMVYIYAEVPDPEKKTKTFLSIGYGKEATESAKEAISTGYVSDVLYDQEIEAFRENKTTFCYDNNEYGETIVCYAPVKRHLVYGSSGSDTDAAPDGLMLQPDAEFKEETLSIVGAEMTLGEILRSFRRRYVYIFIFILLSSLLIVFIISFILKRRIEKPVHLISRKMTDFVHDRGDKFEPLEIKGHDEFAKMAEAFNSMALEIDNYIDNISELNREKATREAELNIARDIQNGFLEPVSFRNENASILACMKPAKDVGGDLYDYRVLSDGSILVIIADVSGKGISAALFMTNAITMLRQYAETGLSPGKMMVEYNNHLVNHNPNMMFITTFIGIYHPDTGDFIYSNAGHNPPYLLSDSLIEIESACEAAAGIFEEEKYTERCLKLKPGDTLFLYTDGVTEAKSSDDSLYGDDKLREILSEHLQRPGEEVLDAVLGSVREFTRNAEQSDDITILTMTVPDVTEYTLSLEAKTENLKLINEKIFSLDISEDDKCMLRLIAEEIFVNICSYAYKDGAGKADITISQKGKKVTLVFTDSGMPFDPTKDLIDIDDYDPDVDIGGLGRFLTFEVADEYHYQYSDGKNIMTIIKSFDNSKE